MTEQEINELSIHFTPIGDKVIIFPDLHTDVSETGIIIPTTDTESSKKGTVVAVGNGYVNPSTGEPIPLQVKLHDRVVMPTFGGTKFDYETDEFYVFRESELLIILT